MSGCQAWIHYFGAVELECKPALQAQITAACSDKDYFLRDGFNSYSIQPWVAIFRAAIWYVLG